MTCLFIGTGCRLHHLLVIIICTRNNSIFSLLTYPLPSFVVNDDWRLSTSVDIGQHHLVNLVCVAGSVSPNNLMLLAIVLMECSIW